MENIELLKRIPIFGDLSEDEYKELSKMLKNIEFRKDEVICSHEASGDALFLIESGRVKVTLYSEGGKEIILSILKNGDFFGEMALLDGDPRSANVIALERSKILVLERPDFLNHIERSPDLVKRILKIMSQRLRQADEQIGNLALLDVYGRIARFLIHIAKVEGEETVEGIVIESLPTHQEIAGLVGTSRETVSRTLSDLKKKGILKFIDKKIVIGYKALEEVKEKFSY